MEEYTCIICCKVYSKKFDLRQHIKRAHVREWYGYGGVCMSNLQ